MIYDVKRGHSFYLHDSPIVGEKAESPAETKFIGWENSRLDFPSASSAVVAHGEKYGLGTFPDRLVKIVPRFM